MTLTLIGDTIISFFLTLFADALGRKATLALGAALMSGSGVIFALFGNYWVLLSAAIFGVISPRYAAIFIFMMIDCLGLKLMLGDSGNEIGPFRAIEESTLAQLTPAAIRSDIYAWYSLIGTAGAACGMMVCGWLIHYMRYQLHWNEVETYRAVFWGYAVFGLIKFFLALGLSKKCEVEKKVMPVACPETAPLLGDGAEDVEPKKSKFRSWLPKISKDSRIVVFNLCVLFALDAFASGLAPL